VRRADNFTTIICRLSWNQRASDSWKPQGLSRPVLELLCFAMFCFLITMSNQRPKGQLQKKNNTKTVITNCIFMRMVTRVTETCRWLPCNKIAFILWNASVGPFLKMKIIQTTNGNEQDIRKTNKKSRRIPDN